MRDHRHLPGATTTIHRRDVELTNSVTKATGDLVVGEDAQISIEIEAIGGP